MFWKPARRHSETGSAGGRWVRKNNMTIKMRLALLFTFLVALILGCFTWLIYAFASYQRSEVFYSELKMNAIATATIVLRSDNLSDSILEPYRKKVLQKLYLESINIFNADNVSVFHQGDKSLTLNAEEKRNASEKGMVLLSSKETQKVIFPFLDEDKRYFVTISAVDEQGLKTMAKLRWSLVIGYVTSLLIVFGVGKWFASKAIAPLANITRQAEKLSATDLHVRVDVGTQRDELYQLAQAFNGMLDRLEKAFRSQKQFIANASHELRTPLTTMEGQLEVSLMKTRGQEEYRQTISGALEETRALRMMTNNLLLLTRADADILLQDMREHRIDEILFSALEEAKQRHPDRTVEIEYLAIPQDDGCLMIKGNNDLLCNAFLNIIENAFKYSDPITVIKVTIEIAERFLHLRITDTGVGITAEDMPRIFEPFFRSSRTNTVSGSGIGLTLVRAILERHSGTIKVESIPDQGTTFQVTLPSSG